MSPGVRTGALAQELAREATARYARAGVEVADALLPVLVERVHEVGQPAAAGLEKAHAQRRKAVEQPLEDRRRQRHLHLVPVPEDVGEDEGVALFGDARRQTHAERAS